MQKLVLSGKKPALFGTYGWGGGEWMRASAGLSLAAEPVIVNNAPGDNDAAACRALGEALARA